MPEAGGPGGAYFSDCKVKKTSKEADVSGRPPPTAQCAQFPPLLVMDLTTWSQLKRLTTARGRVAGTAG
jgi:hypothetical protein